MATAGTPATLAHLQNNQAEWDHLHGTKLSFKQVENWQKKLAQLSFEKRKQLKGMPIYRADVLPAGLSLLKKIMQKFHWDQCVVSITGLRYGLLCQFSFAKEKTPKKA